MKKVIAFLFLLTVFFVLTSCKKASFTINFIVDGAVYASIDTGGNETIQMPQNPTKEGYEFDGWYWDKDTWKKQFTARSLLDTPLSSNMEVYAHFVNESSLKGTDMDVKDSLKMDIPGVGDVFYLEVPNNQVVLKFNDYVETNPSSSWIISTDIGSNNTISSKTVELSLGDNPLYYIYVTDANDKHETYVVLVHRNYMFTVAFNAAGGSSCSSVEVEEGHYLANVPTSTRTGYLFKSWDYDFENNPIKSNVFATAMWKANEYTISYDPNGGNVSPLSQKVKYDDNYNLQTPWKKGYVFKGWNNNGSSILPMSGIWTITNDVDLTAQWELDYYSCKYELNGGTACGALKTSYTIDDSFTLPSVAKTGYTFNGWSTSPSLTNAKEGYAVEKGTSGNLTFYAKFTANSYTITYDVNGGNDLTTNTQKVSYDSNLSLPIPTKTNYVFSGWYDGTIKISDGVKWNYATDKTLIAHWIPKEYTIEYNLNGGTNSTSNPKSYNIESNKITLDDPTKKGYTFIGWTTESVTQPTPKLAIESGSQGAKSFVANWKANTYTVTFDVNGGNSLDYNNKEYVYDSDVLLDSPVRTGYTFAGWYCGAELVSNGKWSIAENSTLIAKWTANQYTITKENISGEKFETVTYDEKFSIGAPSKSGYTFKGYYTGEYGTGIQYTNSNGESINAYTDAKDLTLYAFFTYTISFITNGGTSVQDLELNENEFLSNLIVSEKDNLTFDGWFTDASLTIPVSHSESLGNIRLYAKWKEEAPTSQLSYSTLNGEVSLTGSTFDGTNLVLPSYIAGNPVVYIEKEAFANMTNISSLIVPDTVTAIGIGAFKGCSSLETITLPFVGNKIDSTNYTSTFGYIFGCLNNANYSVATSNNNNTGYTVQGYTNGGTYYGYYIPKTIKNVTITVQTNIPANAFYNCDLIEKINIPTTVTSIGSSSFYNCANLVTLNSEVEGTFNIPNEVEIINDGTFFGCAKVTNITLSNNVSSIGAYAFKNCKLVEKFNSSNEFNIVIPTSCASVGSYAFEGLGLIDTIIVPDTVTAIGIGAFKGCSSLETITLPFVGNKIDSTNYTSTFGYIFGCLNNANYSVATSNNNNTGYTVQGYTNGGTYYGYYIPKTIKNVTITVQTNIPANAFYNCDLIEKIHVIDATTFNNNSLYNCVAQICYDVVPTVSSPWDGSTISTGYRDGDGTIDNPYQIFAASEYMYFVNEINNGVDYSNTYFILTSSINFNNYDVQQISPSDMASFCGVLDGNNKSIKNFNISVDSQEYIGLFGYVSGTIKNLVVENGNINLSYDDSNNYYCGMLVGHLDGIIDNVTINATVSFSCKKTCYVGGIVGYNSGSISNSVSNEKLNVTSTNYKCYVGGLIGYNSGNYSDCLFEGAISANGYSDSYTVVDNFVGFASN